MSSLTRKTWDDFQAVGLLWFVNRILHVFGWAIVLEVDEGKAVECYPARCKFRGFSTSAEHECFEKVARYMRETSRELYDEAEYPPADDKGGA